MFDQVTYNDLGPGGDACIKCHEIKPAHWAWKTSAHRDVQCAACHGGLFTTDLAFHWNHLQQLVAHVRGEVPERLLVRHADLMRGLHESCGNCHAAEFAAWKAGPHGASYERIFLHEPHNKKRFLSDHCLACHQTHTQSARNSCVSCHPGLSNGGLFTQCDRR